MGLLSFVRTEPLLQDIKPAYYPVWQIEASICSDNQISLEIYGSCMKSLVDPNFFNSFQFVFQTHCLKSLMDLIIIYM